MMIIIIYKVYEGDDNNVPVPISKTMIIIIVVIIVIIDVLRY